MCEESQCRPLHGLKKDYSHILAEHLKDFDILIQTELLNQSITNKSCQILIKNQVCRYRSNVGEISFIVQGITHTMSGEIVLIIANKFIPETTVELRGTIWGLKFQTMHFVTIFLKFADSYFFRLRMKYSKFYGGLCRFCTFPKSVRELEE